MQFQIIILQAATQGSGYTTLLMMAMIFAVFYFFMIRPQAKKQKQQTKFVDAIKKGDEVVTNSGIIGKVNKIDGNEVSLQVDTKTYIRIYKSAISQEMSAALHTESDPVVEKA